MKRFCILLFCITAVVTWAMAQATSLTIDNQIPGWLSSKINFGDQVTLENLTVTGYLNGTDIKFLHELNQQRSLHGTIDLSDANIVSGGDCYYRDDKREFYTRDNVISDYMFTSLSCQKLILPKSIVNFEYESNYRCFSMCKIDTLIISGSPTIVQGFDSQTKIRHISIPEGVECVGFETLNRGSQKLSFDMPSSIKEIGASYAFLNVVIHSVHMSPQDITTWYRNNSYMLFNAGTIYVPKGTAELYKNNPIFTRLNVIEQIYAESLSLNITQQMLHAGESILLHANILPENAINKTIKWNSNNINIATVDDNGNVVAVGAGVTEIVAKTSNGLEAVCQVTVYDLTESIDVEDEVSIKIGESYILNAKTLPETSDGFVAYESSNPAIATVDESGKINGVSKGCCIITLSSYKNLCKKECMVRVMQPVTGLFLNKVESTINVGESLQIKATVSPYDADNQAVDWTSSDESVAVVDASGRVVAKKAGIATITATSNDNPVIKAECEITVLQPVVGISLNQTSLRLTSIGEAVQLVATVTPDDASNKTVNWNTSDNAVCMVSQNGTVVATGRGHAVVIATAVDGGFMAICNVTVTTFHKLTYLVDGEEYYSETLEYGSVIAPKEAPTKEGYTFSGWSNLPVTMPAEDVVVTGSFTINSYDVIYFVDEVEYMRQAYNYGESVVALEAPKKDGYLFSGWSEIPETMPAHDVNVYGTMIVDGINSMYSASGKFTVYTAQGTWLKADASIDDIKTLPNGLYIINGKKVVIK